MEKEKAPNNQTATLEVQSELKEVPKSLTKKPWLIIGLTVLVLLLLGTTGLFAYQNYQLKKKVSRESFPSSTINGPTPTASTIAPLTPTIDPTTGWQSYNNGEYKFSFKYPDDYYLHDKFLKILPENSHSFLGIIIIKDKNKELGQPPTISLSIVQTAKSAKEFLDYDYQRELGYWENFEKERGFRTDKPRIISEENVQTGQVTALKVERQMMPTAPNSKETWYLVKKGNLLYLFRANYGTYNPDTGEDGTDEKKALDLIFSTFKFLQ
jgi:hypothetical protein